MILQRLFFQKKYKDFTFFLKDTSKIILSFFDRKTFSLLFQDYWNRLLYLNTIFIKLYLQSFLKNLFEKSHG